MLRDAKHRLFNLHSPWALLTVRGSVASLLAAIGVSVLAGVPMWARPVGRQQPQATVIRVSFVGPGRAPATVTRARLLLAAWGVSDVLRLTPRGNTLAIDLSKSRRPRWASGFADFRAYLYVESDGFAPILSRPFDWVRPGEAGPVSIDFGEGRRTTVREGSRADLLISMRTPIPRRVRLVDETGAPFRGVRVDAVVFWTDSNHCGAINRDLEVGSAVTNDDGWMALPDGEFEYALMMDSADIVFPHTPAPSSSEAIVRLADSQTLVAHRIVRRTLRVRVQKDGRGVQGLSLFSDLVHCCGACSGEEGVTDAEGVIAKERWAQEILGDMWLCEGGREVWSGAAKDVPADELRIALPVIGARADRRYSRCPSEAKDNPPGPAR